MFVYIKSEPVDWWDGAVVEDSAISAEVLAKMPEEPRYPVVYKTFVPYSNRLEPIYLCKADNNGDTYIFTTREIHEYFEDVIPF